MSVAVKSPKVFTATEALAAFRRVKLTASSGTAVEYADQSDSSNYIGITLEDAAIGTHVAVALKGMAETHKAVAADTFSVGATLYAADDGKVSDTSSGNAIGTALEACTAAGDIVEVILDNGSAAHTFARTSITQEDAVAYPVKIGEFRVWDAPSTVAVAATAANDDLAVVYNTFKTAGPSIESGDLKNAGATSRKVGFQWALPAEYTDAQTITLRINGGMKTTVASTSATVDVECVNITNDATADICATTAEDINSLTPADCDFTITPTNCEAGDLLDVVITVAVNDTGTGTAVIGKLYSVTWLLDIKG